MATVLRSSVHVTVAGLAFSLGSSGLAADHSLEEKVKAAFLLNFAKFVEWPSLPENTLTICAVGAGGVGEILSGLSSRQVKARTLRVELGPPVDAVGCQVLYFGQSEKNPGSILARVKGDSLLTVGDTPEFARYGGIIGFYLDAGNVKLEINPESARVANLRISSKLLEVARIVR